MTTGWSAQHAASNLACGMCLQAEWGPGYREFKDFMRWT